ncbi:transposase (plasmid) [Paraclostridium bifermentans]|uniref:Transposase n=1 Tax=Paraclostridium bifermentans TaxID=1490 RepID=A0A5P3XKM3_PARBF|nr:DUF6262 family protein [Paraclostridium bifermentans]QEZ68711.1 transposase [Paraclostridium bifermentans]QEZ70863.1 transposase [Paraclostridium bifermentans]
MKRNTNAIVEMAKIKSYETKQKVEQTISRLVVENKSVNFNTVSKESGVSKSWLYKNEDIKNRISNIRNEQNSISTSKSKKVTKTRSDNSKDVLIRSLKNKIKDLEKENLELKNQLEVLYGELYGK